MTEKCKYCSINWGRCQCVGTNRFINFKREFSTFEFGSSGSVTANQICFFRMKLFAVPFHFVLHFSCRPLWMVHSVANLHTHAIAISPVVAGANTLAQSAIRHWIWHFTLETSKYICAVHSAYTSVCCSCLCMKMHTHNRRSKFKIKMLAAFK